MSKLYKEIFLVVLTVLLFSLLSLVSYKYLLVEDIWKLFTANQTDGGIWYWWKIFTTPHHGNTQYRPLSFFAYPYFARFIFGTNLSYYYGVGVALLSANCLLLFRVIKKVTAMDLAAYLGVALFATHPTTWLILEVPSFHVKYFVPLLALLFSLLYSNRLVIALLYLIAILCHEGSIVFPIVLLVWRRKWVREDIYLFIPFAFYMMMRLFVLSFSNQGFMKISLWTFPQNLILFLNHLWNFLFADNVPGVITLIILLGLVAFFAIKRDWGFALSSLLISFILLLPFAALKDHALFNRCFWAVPFVAIFFCGYFSKTKWMKILLPGILLLNIFFARNTLGHAFHLLGATYPTTIEIFVNEISKKIAKREGPFEVVLTNRLPNRWAERTVLAGILAAHFPNQTFFMAKDDRLYSRDIFVSKGSYYFKSGAAFFDPFDQIVDFTPPSSFDPLEIDNSAMLPYVSSGE